MKIRVVQTLNISVVNCNSLLSYDTPGTEFSLKFVQYKTEEHIPK